MMHRQIPNCKLSQIPKLKCSLSRIAVAFAQSIEEKPSFIKLRIKM